MTDNYYRLADVPDPNAFDQQVLSIETALASATPATAQALLDQGQVVLTELWNAALARNDEGAMTAVSASWDHMNALKLQADTGIATAHAAVAGMKTAVEQRDQIAGELETLTEAVMNFDADHPLVGDLIESLQESESDYLYEQVSDSLRDDMTWAIRRCTHLDSHSAYALVDALTSYGRVLDDGQIDTLVEYLQALKSEPEAEAS